MIHYYNAEERQEAMQCLGRTAAFSDVSKEMADAQYKMGKTSTLVAIDQHPTNPYISSLGGRFAFVAVDAPEPEMWFVVVMHKDQSPESNPSMSMGPYDESTSERVGIDMKKMYPNARVFPSKAIHEIMEDKTFKMITL
jgi:hypothetical protein